MQNHVMLLWWLDVVAVAVHSDGDGDGTAGGGGGILSVRFKALHAL